MSRHYTVQQAAEITQVSAFTLRFYERIGLLHVGRAQNGHRRYKDEDLGWVRFILLLRATGMSLPQIAIFMQLEKDGQSTIDKRQHMLAAHRHDLNQHITELQSHLAALDAKIEYYQTTTSERCDCVRAELQVTS
jgi:DNA-binding transcriptional MerR regulator